VSLKSYSSRCTRDAWLLLALALDAVPKLVTVE
jgi:hypothetical protein